MALLLEVRDKEILFQKRTEADIQCRLRLSAGEAKEGRFSARATWKAGWAYGGLAVEYVSVWCQVVEVSDSEAMWE